MTPMTDVELRISDNDRERAAAVLHTAVADGRLTWLELEERLTGVYASRTGAELRPWLADLAPQRAVASTMAPAASPLAPAASSEPLRVLLGKVRRRPDVDVGHVHVEAVLGAVVLDLRDLPTGCVVDVLANSLLGKVEVYISPGTRLVDTGTASLGKRSVVEHRRRRDPRVTPGPDAAVVRVSGHSTLGHVRVTVG
jgi:hypothetical protein